jgi:hypothetical protein
MTDPIAEIAAERRRQIEVEDWTPEHDDEHTHGELAIAAACYSVPLSGRALQGFIRAYWPWNQSWWKPTTRRRNLIKAGALIVAEIERLDRLEPKP